MQPNAARPITLAKRVTVGPGHEVEVADMDDGWRQYQTVVRDASDRLFVRPGTKAGSLDFVPLTVNGRFTNSHPKRGLNWNYRYVVNTTYVRDNQLSCRIVGPQRSSDAGCEIANIIVFR